MEKKTLFTEIPVFQGGMGIGVSLGGLAGAVAACGGGGTISAAQIGFQEPDFRENPLAANLRAIGRDSEGERNRKGTGSGRYECYGGRQPLWGICERVHPAGH